MKIEWFMVGFLGSALFMNVNYKVYTIIALIAFVILSVKSIFDLDK